MVLCVEMTIKRLVQKIQQWFFVLKYLVRYTEYDTMFVAFLLQTLQHANDETRLLTSCCLYVLSMRCLTEVEQPCNMRLIRKQPLKVNKFTR